MTPEQIAELEKKLAPGHYSIPVLTGKDYDIAIIGKRAGKTFEQTKYAASLHARMKDPLWKQAFEEYNLANPDNQYHMGCSPCFGKVLFWHKETLINKEL